MSAPSGGPLHGVQIIEFAGLGPAPFAAMMLADMGSDVIRVDRPHEAPAWVDRMRRDPLNRSRRSIALDLKNAAGVELALRLISGADALIEGFRPGVMERLGLGPDGCMERNSRLVYGRMTGYGQDGPLRDSAGHDINYIGLSGLLAAVGPADGSPLPPLNVAGDFGGGGMLLAFGVLCALWESSHSGQGQVVDAAMVEGSALLMAMTHGLRAIGDWELRRGVNRLDGGAHFYAAYECADGQFIAVGAVEPQFYARVLDILGLEGELPPQMQRESWPEMRQRFAEIFRTRPRAEWLGRFEGVDACVTPVLDLDEAPSHPQNTHRETFIVVDGVRQPAPAPRYSRTGAATPAPPRRPGADTAEILGEIGLSSSEIDRYRSRGALG